VIDGRSGSLVLDVLSKVHENAGQYREDLGLRSPREEKPLGRSNIMPISSMKSERNHRLGLCVRDFWDREFTQKSRAEYFIELAGAIFVPHSSHWCWLQSQLGRMACQ
jgi:hypothetical protein